MLRYLHVPSRSFASLATEQSVILMHGFGASAENLLSLISMIDGARQYNWILPLAPYPLHDPNGGGFSGYAWFPQDQAEQLRALSGGYFQHLEQVDGDELVAGAAAIERLRSALAIPYSALVIGGFSQGAIMTVEFLLSAPEPCAGALLFSGTLIARERWQRTQTRAIATPFLQTHGRGDEILPIHGGEALYRLLQDKGFPGKFADFDGGHAIPQQQLAQAATLLSRWYGAAV